MDRLERQALIYSEDTKIEKEFWENILGGIEEISCFPYDNAKTSLINCLERSQINFNLPDSVSEKIIKIAKASDENIYCILLTAVKILLYKYTGNRDSITGSTVYRQEAEDDLINKILILRNSIDVNMSFKEFLINTRKIFNEALSNQNIPLDVLIENTKALSVNNISDFFKTVVLLKNIHETDYLKGLSPNIVFVFKKDYESISCDISYNKQFYSESTIQRITKHLISLLDMMLDNLDIKLEDIQILTKEEWQQLLVSFNNTAAEYPKNKTIHDIFREQVQRTPDNIAVTLEDKKLTYKELNERANRLARTLKKLDINNNDIIGILLDRSIEMIVSILAVLKAGGAYLPIDPEYPQDRIKYTLEDSKTKIVLTNKKFEALVKFTGQVLYVEDENVYDEIMTELPDKSSPNDLAYVIYTSGTTGKPKGAMIEHKNVVRLMFNNKIQFDFTSEDVWTMFHSFCFDFSVWEMYGALFYGGKLVIVPKLTARQPRKYLELLKKEKVTILNQTPTAFYNLSNEEVSIKEKELSIRYVIFGGEALKPIMLKSWREKYPGTKLINMYGITETTVHVTYKEITEHEIENNISNIGKPIPTLTAYVMDRDMKLLPIGAAGELCVGGDGVCRGYLNRPELTAEKFINNPYKEGERLYKSGDLVRMLPTGEMEYLGRIDHQVKIRGHRIELGEIENKLIRHGAIKEAVVSTKDDSSGNKYLCAYIAGTRELTIGELREYLSKDLPDYMIPSYFMQMDKLPLTSNGKIDRKALPEPDKSVSTGAEYEAPRNEIEEKLSEIWREVLGADTMGINDSFFMLGGDSIKAIQVCSRLQRYKMKLEVKHILQYPSIKEVSNYVTYNTNIAEQGIITEEIELTPIQKWFFDNDYIDKHHWNQAVMLYSKESFDEEALNKAFEKITEHHDILRAVYKIQENKVIQINRGIEGQLYELKVFDLKNEENYGDIIPTEANKIQSSMDLRNGPLVKLGLFKTSEGDHLLITIHHLVVDGVSWRIIFEDLSKAYSQAVKGEEIVLQDKTDSFKLWGEELKKYANSKKQLKELDYWKRIEETEVLPLPKDNIVNIGKTKDTAAESIELSEAETETLLKKVNSAYNTEINDILLTSLGMTINKWTGCDKVLINLEGHGRELEIKGIDITRTVGWFTSQFPVILDMHGTEGLSHSVVKTKETLRQIPNKGIGYGILKYITSQENKKGLSFERSSEICFNYLGQFDKDINTEVFQVSHISAGNSISLEAQRNYSLDVSGMIINKKLYMSFKYDRNEYNKTTIEELSKNYAKNLIELIKHCADKEYTELTPSDTTGKRIALEEFNLIKKRLAEIGIIEPQISDIYTLSPMQEGMLFYTLLDNKSNVYFEQMVLNIEGNIDIKLFEESFNKVINKYDVLRTVFVHEGVKKPVQVILKDIKTAIHYEDIMALEKEKKEEYVEEYKQKDKEKGFNLKMDIPIRVSILKLDHDKYAVIWSFHHIIMDGWCLSLVIKDFFDSYISIKERKKIDIEKVEAYGRYISWLEEQDKEEAIAYWKRYLEGFEHKSSVPVIKTSKNGEEYQNREKVMVLNKDISKGLVKLAQGAEVTLSTVIQTVWGVILQRYNNTEDVVFGAVVSGRPSEVAGIENMVGLFINTVPVRFRVSGLESMEEAAKKLQRQAAESSKYEYISLAEVQLISELKNELIDNILVFENYPMEKEIENSTQENRLGFEIKAVEVFEQTNYGINIIVSPGEEVTIRIRYNGAVYEDAQVLNLLSHINQVINTVVSRPSIMLRDIQILSEEEKYQMLVSFNNTAVEYPKHKTIQELFEEQAETIPDNIALVYGEQRLTYKELNEKSNQLARVLKMKGIKAEDVAALMVERSPEMVIGILGVLKAGAAYLPIDPEYPKDRIEFMLQDSNAKLLLTQAEFVNSSNEKLEKIGLKDIKIYTGDSSNPWVLNKAEDLCCIMYTSGSTGKPKGVMIEHRNVVRLVKSTNYIEFRSDDRILQTGAIVFDACTFEIWGALLNGLELHLTDASNILDANKLGKIIERNKITILWLTSSLFNRLVQQREDIFNGLRYLLVGGDVLSPKHINTIKDKYKDIKIVNGYGPTENTTFSTCYVIDKEHSNNIPIGKPISNSTAYIIDKTNNLQPIGIKGELCVGGDGLARGYLNRPELTTEKFTDNPFIPETKMYRTGDLARWLPDGSIEFLGRIDHQVKIRGFRIELGEIENKLLEHDLVKEAVVAIKEGKNNDKYLCAYIIGKGEFNAAELREYLSKDLPGYMIPSYFLKLEKLPLTPNGKVDRKSLPEPDGDITTGVEYEAPGNEIEEKLADIWKEVLNIQRIGINDNFFEVGGHSLNLISLANKINQVFKVNVKMTNLFKHLTIKNMSSLIIKAFISEDEQLAALLNEEKDNKIFCFPPILGYGIAYKEVAEKLSNYAVYSFNFTNKQNIVEEYTDYIVKTQSEGEYILFGYSIGGNMAFEVAKELEKRNKVVNKLIIMDSAVVTDEVKKRFNENENQRIDELKEKIEEYKIYDVHSHEILEKTISYGAYFRGIVHQGTINADIHYIQSSILDNSEIRKWDLYTSGKCVYYNGYGAHIDMLSGENYSRNIEIIESILRNTSLEL